MNRPRPAGPALSTAILLLVCALPPSARAAGDIDAFLARAFDQAPAPAMLWLTPAVRAQAQADAGFAPEVARLRYWRDGERTAWVIDRVGKEEPITFGVVVDHDAIVAIEVIAYRENRGQEIRAPRWLAKFAGARNSASGLDRHIDNITGATLSVRASVDVARLALFAHRQVTSLPLSSKVTVNAR